MKKYILTVATSLLSLSVSAIVGADVAQGAKDINVESSKMVRNDDVMTVSMTLDMSDIYLKSNRSALLVPVIVNGGQTQELPAVGVYGRNRWFQRLRAEGKSAESDELLSVRSYKRLSKRVGTVEYSQSIPYEEWMNGAHLELLRNDCGCCNTVLAESGAGVPVGSGYSCFTPDFHYIRPVAEASKVRELHASAYVDYPVDRTDIHPEFRNNRMELSRITQMIDSLRGDADVTVSSLKIKGFASPEGEYSRNERLARERTEALKQYVSGLYSFDEDFIVTSYEAEDWEGLRRHVAESSLPNREELLAVIDDDTLSPDSKDWRMKIHYADDYKYLLENVFPSLRRSDYRVEYTVRHYDDVEKIREIMETAPQKLSLEEMYLLAQTMEPGSDEFNEVFETAVRMFPNDETANLNAANAAMSRGDLRRAKRYLDKAGDSAEAAYARGIFEELTNNLK